MGRIVSVHSYRGGTGKSNLTANLATTLAAQGLRVGIVDTDIQSPGIHVIFGLDEQKINRALNDYLYGRCPIADTAYSITLPEVAARGGNIFLIPSSVKTGEILRVLKEGYHFDLLRNGFEDLLEHLKLDYLLIDTHPGLNEETLLSIALSDVFVLILRPDRQDFQGTAVTVEVARKLKVQRMLLVVNKALTSLDQVALREQVENTYNTEVAAILPQCNEMLQLASSGVFCLHYPNHPFTLEVRKLAQRVME